MQTSISNTFSSYFKTSRKFANISHLKSYINLFCQFIPLLILYHFWNSGTFRSFIYLIIFKTILIDHANEGKIHRCTNPVGCLYAHTLSRKKVFLWDYTCMDLSFWIRLRLIFLAHLGCTAEIPFSYHNRRF